MQKLKTKTKEKIAKQYDNKGNVLEITKDGEQILKLNEELSEKVRHNELYKSLLSQLKYDNPELIIELNESLKMPEEINEYENLAKKLIEENPSLELEQTRINELQKVDDLSNILRTYSKSEEQEKQKEMTKNNYKIIEEPVINPYVNPYKSNQSSNGFRRYNVCFPIIKKTPYTRTKGIGYTSIRNNFRNYRGNGGVGGGGGGGGFNGCGSP